ncbi:MAG TPA: flavodoxin domain-containing protein [Candidatus Atribacteria bacterium]|jgi:NAD(P)H dehydrogenase (quinone)|uniref:flavodoxin family protein n=1 Tax=Candidatus Sordicultor fermentans TaxID=1953203 RepID=UPI0016A683D3|nr:flavodoxin domain-containing protein [Atribacterota bacterium]NLY05356.1 flavodoxin family protein [Candidatus Atribacteria bacterium]MDI9606787.1 flavodoxin domain-containing protein [Atribacterota bacterium]MDY0134500.1 flavodoxin domain-containing protein [Atribacterota bacterium]HOA99688.1 flavodoxin domain-containing protein [Candidatus Atribacteria bacterium]
MSQALVLYYTRTGTTEKMAQAIADTLSEEGVSTDLVDVSQFQIDDLTKYDLIVIGSPTYYGTMAAEIKEILDESIKLHGDLNGKIGGAFSSSANRAGGNETTIWSILSALLIHGMVIKGVVEGSHYGPVAVGTFDDKAKKDCQNYARELSQLLKSLKSAPAV